MRVAAAADDGSPWPSPRPAIVASREIDDLYRRHGAEVYRYAYAVLGNHADAEDVTQTTFLNAYRALEQGVQPAQAVELAPDDREQRDQAAVPAGAGAATPGRARRASGSPGGRRRGRAERRRAPHRTLEDPAAAAPGDRPARVRGALVRGDRRDPRRHDVCSRDAALQSATLARRGARAPADVHRGAARGLEVRRRTARPQGTPAASRPPRRVPRLRAVRAPAAAPPHCAARAHAHPDPALASLFKGLEGAGTASAATLPAAAGAGSVAAAGPWSRGRAQSQSAPERAVEPPQAGGCSPAAWRSRRPPRSPRWGRRRSHGDRRVQSSKATRRRKRRRLPTKPGSALGQVAPRGVSVPGNGVARGKPTAPGQVKRTAATTHTPTRTRSCSRPCDSRRTTKSTSAAKRVAGAKRVDGREARERVSFDGAEQRPRRTQDRRSARRRERARRPMRARRPRSRRSPRRHRPRSRATAARRATPTATARSPRPTDEPGHGPHPRPRERQRAAGTADFVSRHAIPRRTRCRAHGRPRFSSDRRARAIGEGRASSVARGRSRAGAEPRQGCAGLAAAPCRRRACVRPRAATRSSMLALRLLRARLRGRHGLQRADQALLHEPRLANVVGRRGALSQPGTPSTTPAIVDAWLDSPPHRAIILSPTWRDAGIGALYAPSAPKEFGGAEAVVVTADFGLREGRTCALVSDRGSRPTLRVCGSACVPGIDLGREPAIPGHDDAALLVDLVDDAAIAGAQSRVVARSLDELDPGSDRDAGADPSCEKSCSLCVHTRHIGFVGLGLYPPRPSDGRRPQTRRRSREAPADRSELDGLGSVRRHRAF